MSIPFAPRSDGIEVTIIPCSGERAKVLIFNCTSGRTGNAFLGAMLARAADQLKKHGRSQEASALFDQVIFCANVTYADGNFKGGTLPLHSRSSI